MLIESFFLTWVWWVLWVHRVQRGRRKIVKRRGIFEYIIFRGWETCESFESVYSLSDFALGFYTGVSFTFFGRLGFLVSAIHFVKSSGEMPRRASVQGFHFSDFLRAARMSSMEAPVCCSKR